MGKSKWQCTDWIVESLSALRPPEKVLVSDWAEKNRVLKNTESSKPGRYKTSFTEYIREIMDSFCDPEVEEITLVKPTQVGGTTAMLNMMGYALDIDPAPMMAVYPKDDLAESISMRKIQPMINGCASLRKKYDANSKRTELEFSGGVSLKIASANSPASLAADQIKYLFLDEEEKYPKNAGKEASPGSLAIERTKTYKGTRKIVRISTPVLEDGVIWQNWLTADTQKQCFVTCPHCGESWTFQFKQLLFETTSAEAARKSAKYVCEECGAIITDREKVQMVRHCEWRTVKTNGSRRKTAYWFNTFYSPHVSFSDIAAEWVDSHARPEKLQNFINSWLAEPYRQVDTTMDADTILNERKSGYSEFEVPPGTLMLTGGVDVQRKSFYWTIRAWKPNMASYNIAHGQVFTWEEICFTMNQVYSDPTMGRRYQVTLCCVDSGDQTDEVYTFCTLNAEWAMPIKGSSTRLDSKYLLKRIEKDGIAKGRPFARVDTEYYKDMIYARMKADEEHGGWFIYDGCDPLYCEMVTSEQKVVERVRGHLTAHWKPKQAGAANHYLDCEVYAACAADLAGMRTMMERQKLMEQASAEPNWTGEQPSPPTQAVVDARQKPQGYFSSRRH